MQTAVVVGTIAVTAENWEEAQGDGTRETGCRVQVRRARAVPAPVPPPVPRRDAVYWSIEEPIWRADLFTDVGGSAPYDAAHDHPTFIGMTPCDRVADDGIRPDPVGWSATRLADLPAILTEAGHPELIAELDHDAWRVAMPAVLAAIEVTLTVQRPPAAGGA